MVEQVDVVNAERNDDDLVPRGAVYGLAYSRYDCCD